MKIFVCCDSSSFIDEIVKIDHKKEEDVATKINEFLPIFPVIFFFFVIIVTYEMNT